MCNQIETTKNLFCDNKCLRSVFWQIKIEDSTLGYMQAETWWHWPQDCASVSLIKIIISISFWHKAFQQQTNYRCLVNKMANKHIIFLIYFHIYLFLCRSASFKGWGSKNEAAWNFELLLIQNVYVKSWNLTNMFI